MAFGYDVKELIESIKVRCLVPISQITFSEEDILRFANEEIQMKIVPNVIRVKEEFYVTKKIFPIENSNKSFEIPYRAIGSKIRYVGYEYANNHYPLTRIQPEDLPYFEYGASADTTNAFYLEGNFVKLGAQFSQGVGNVEMSYYLTPNTLVDPQRVGVISSIDRVGDGTIGSVTISNLSFPQNINPATLVDFLQVRPNFRTYSFDIPVTNVNPTTSQIFLALKDIPDSVLVGDHIASAGECIIPQIPRELHSMLAQTTACRILEAMGDNENLAQAYKKLGEMESNLFALIDQRTEGNPQKINNLNGIMTRSKIGYRRYGGGYRP